MVEYQLICWPFLTHRQCVPVLSQFELEVVVAAAAVDDIWSHLMDLALSLLLFASLKGVVEGLEHQQFSLMGFWIHACFCSLIETLIQ